MDEDVKKHADEIVDVLRKLSDLETRVFDRVKGRVVEFNEGGCRTLRGEVIGLGHNNQWDNPWVYLVVRLIRRDGTFGYSKRYPSLDEVRFVEEVNG